MRSWSSRSWQASCMAAARRTLLVWIFEPSFSYFLNSLWYDDGIFIIFKFCEESSILDSSFYCHEGNSWIVVPVLINFCYLRDIGNGWPMMFSGIYSYYLLLSVELPLLVWSSKSFEFVTLLLFALSTGFVMKLVCVLNLYGMSGYPSMLL